MLRGSLVRASLAAVCAAALIFPVLPAQGAAAAAPSGPMRPADLKIQATVTRGEGRRARAAHLPVRHGPAARGAAARVPFTSQGATSAPLAPVSQAVAGQGLGANGASPADSTGAIGTNHYIEMVNATVGLYNRSLASISSVDLGKFVGATTGADVGDVQVEWDQQAQRWLYVSLELYGCGAVVCTDNRIAFGWSKGADASGLTLANTDWCNFHLATSTNLYDYPKLGHDANFLLIGANVFDSGANFLTASIVAIPMPASGDTSCTAPTAAAFGSGASQLKHGSGDPVFTPVPANTVDSSSTGYVSAADLSGKAIGVWHVVPTGGACTVGPCLVHDGEVAITAWNPPAGADFSVPQPGAQDIDALDGRLTQAVQNADPSAAGAEAVWTQHTVLGAGGRTVVTWFELLPAAAVLRQEGTLSNPVLSLFNAAISPTTSGDGAVIHYNTGSAVTFVDVRAQSRDVAEPLNTMSGELILRASTVTDTDGTCASPFGPPCRWGDYAGASPDPTDCATVWGTTMLNGSQSTGAPTWITQNFALSAGSLRTSVSTQQYQLTGSDGVTWSDMDPTKLTVAATGSCAGSFGIVSANVDLFTSTRGVNQDIGLFVDVDGVPSVTPVAWKESGGSSGIFSPNAAYIQAVMPMLSGHTYVARLKWKTNFATTGSIFAGAGPIGGAYSPTRISIHLLPTTPGPASTSTPGQERLTASDGVHWQPMPDVTPLQLTPAADSRVVLGANADLWTDSPGYNQDMGIMVSGGTFGAPPGRLVAWKESGGRAGTFSPNAAFAQAVLDLQGTVTYTVSLVWKTNRPAPPSETIYAGAGPLPGTINQFSPTTLITYELPAGANPAVAVTTTQPHLTNSNGSTWQPLGVQTAALVPAISGYVLLGANADLWTNLSGYNQDLAIFVSVNGGAPQLVAWKESGGLAGTFSPNAAFLQSAYPLVGGRSYVFSLRWKTNRSATGSGGSIFAGAGPIGPAYSPTSLSVETLS